MTLARWLRWMGGAGLVAVLALVVGGEVLVHRAGPMLKARVVETLEARLRGRVELDRLGLSLGRGLEVSGGGLRVFSREDVGALPLMAVGDFGFHVGLQAVWMALRGGMLEVERVRVVRMEVHVPPGGKLGGGAGRAAEQDAGGVGVRVEQFVLVDSRLVLDTADPGREAKVFELRRVELDRVRAGAPLHYEATVENAIPRGEVHAVGSFGPWRADGPGLTALAGHYTFAHADLGSIRGIGGMLSSVGDFGGQLNRIEATGTADVPDFSLDKGRQAMPLKTKFHAVVDGTTGDTRLDPVEARLRNSTFTCRGTVINLKGKGHAIDLEVQVPDGSLQDFLALAVKTRPVLLTAEVATRARLHLPPGKEAVMRKLSLDAGFTLRGMRFTNPAFQQKVDELSLRGQGRPAEAVTGAPAVSAGMTGRVRLSGGRLEFEDLAFTVPGAEVEAGGVYTLDGEQFDVRGKARTQAKASEMVQSWWKQLLLAPVNRYLSRNGAGVELPFTVHGTKGAPQFGLDLEEFKRGRDGRGVPIAR